jgi:hypothetical protein
MDEIITMKKLTEYLEQFGWSKYRAQDEKEEKEGIIYTGWRSSPESSGFNMTIDPIVEKSCLSFKVHKIAMAPQDSTPPDRLKALLMAMAWVNYNIILGKFGYDMRDGEVRFSIDAPIDENDFNYKQFEHSLIIAIRTVDEWAPKFQVLLDGEKTLEEILA